MTTKIDISSLDAETKTKLDYYIDLSNKMMEEGISVDINIKLRDKPRFCWSDGITGFLSPDSSQGNYCKYNLDWEDLEKQENAIKDKYNSLIKEIIEFSDSVADSLKVDNEKFFEEFFL
jgi:hypothetical protein